MIKHIAILLLFPILLHAQSDMENFLNLTEKYNTELLASRNEMLALKSEAKTGLTPSNPTINFGFMPGNTASIGNKTIWGIEQSLDFPTVYMAKKIYSKKIIDHYDLVYQKNRQKILLDASILNCEWIYLLKKQKVFENRMINANKLLNSYNSKLANGNTTILEANKAKILYLSMKSQYEKLKLDLAQTESRVLWMTNKLSIEFNDTIYNINYIPDFEELKSEYLVNSIEMALMKSNKTIINSESNLLKQSVLPGISLGFEAEIETEGTFAGPKFGLELPLWNHKNKRKLAQAKLLSAQTNLTAENQKLLTEFELLYKKTKSLQNNLLDFQETLNNDADLKYIETAFESGQISIIEYINEISFYYNIKDLELETERDFFLYQAKLFSYRL